MPISNLMPWTKPLWLSYTAHGRHKTITHTKTNTYIEKEMAATFMLSKYKFN